MERLRRRAAIDITWVSCRGVRSSLPFHRPCLYASIFAVWSSSAHGHRRHHRVKTPTDRAGGENPEWDAPLRLYLPESAEAPAGADDKKKKKKKDHGDDDDSSSSSNADDDDDVLLVKFEVRAEMAVLGDVHAASAAVPVPDLVADGRTRRVSYQLVGPDGRQPNGVISFSYAFHDRNDDDEDGSQSQSSSDGGEPVSPPSPAVALPSPTIVAAAPRLYPEIEWTLAEQPPAVVYPPVTATNNFTVADTRCYPSAPRPPVEATSVYPPPAPPVQASTSVYPPPVTQTTSSFCSSMYYYPTVVDLAKPAKASALYPTLDFVVAPVSSYYPPAPAYGVGWGERCLYG